MLFFPKFLDFKLELQDKDLNLVCHIWIWSLFASTCFKFVLYGFRLNWVVFNLNQPFKLKTKANLSLLTKSGRDPPNPVGPTHLSTPVQPKIGRYGPVARLGACGRRQAAQQRPSQTLRAGPLPLPSPVRRREPLTGGPRLSALPLSSRPPRLPCFFRRGATRQRTERVSRRPPTLLTPASAPAVGTDSLPRALHPFPSRTKARPRSPDAATSRAGPAIISRPFPGFRATPNPSASPIKPPRPHPENPSHQGNSRSAAAAKRERKKGEETEEGRRRRREKEPPPELPHAGNPYPCNDVAARHGTASTAPCTESPPHRAPRPRARRVSAVVSLRPLSLAPVRFGRR
jgi:hypothetical protein